MGRRTLVLDCARLPAAGMGQVDALARLCLELRRRGCGLELAHPSAELQELIHLAGLAGVLRVEVEGQPEEREDPRRVQEEGELGDAPA